jgi:hypothetical protein
MLVVSRARRGPILLRGAGGAALCGIGLTRLTSAHLNALTRAKRTRRDKLAAISPRIHASCRRTCSVLVHANEEAAHDESLS